MENFCKKFCYRELLEEDDLYILPDILSIIKSIKKYGSVVVFDARCILSGSRCDFTTNTGKISLVNPIRMLSCKKYFL